jgi:hypothetical protein
MNGLRSAVVATLNTRQPGVGAAKPASRRADDDADIRRVNLAMLSALGMSGLVLLMAGWKANAIGPIMLWGIASVAAGAAVGFLFGIPRVGRLGSAAKPAPASPPATTAPTATTQRRDAPTGAGNGDSDSALRPNTNLEEVSDWLTKIIVGLGLVNLKDLQGLVASTAANAAAAISARPSPGDVSIATAMIVGLSIEGFFGGYIYTRLFLQGAFARSDNQLSFARSDIESVLARAPVEQFTNDDKGSMPSTAQVKAATEVERLASRDPRAAIEKMEELAREYEQARSSLPSSEDRTHRMADVVGRMTVIALGAVSQLARFSASARPGERLAAVVILKLRFDGNYSKWLADRLVDDPPFIGFHAASALLAGSRLLGGSQLETLRAAVAASAKILQEKGWNNDPSRDKLIDQILQRGTDEPAPAPAPAPALAPVPAPAS